MRMFPIEISKKIFMALLAVLGLAVIVAVTWYVAWRPGEDKQDHQGRNINSNDESGGINFSLFNDEIILSLDEINCNSIESYEHTSRDDIVSYCNKYFGGDFIKKDDLQLSITESSNIKTDYDASQLKKIYKSEVDDARLLMPNLDKGDFKDVEQSLLDGLSYRNNIDKEYELTLNLVDDLGSFPIHKWHITTSSYNPKEDTNFHFWNICESGCRYNPTKIIDNFLVWHEPLYDIGGVYSICSNAAGERSYIDDEHVKCDMILSIKHYIQWEFKKD